MKQYFQHSCLNNWLFGTLFVSIWTNKSYVIINIEGNLNVAELRNSANELWNSATRFVEFCNKICGILQLDLWNSATNSLNKELQKTMNSADRNEEFCNFTRKVGVPNYLENYSRILCLRFWI